MVISSQDAECKSLVIAYKSSLKIQGRNFDLGSSTADTMSTLEGTTGGEAAIIYFEAAGGRRALMRVLRTVTISWATFPGGRLDGSKDNGAESADLGVGLTTAGNPMPEPRLSGSVGAAASNTARMGPTNVRYRGAIGVPTLCARSHSRLWQASPL